jgi:MFS family permease
MNTTIGTETVATHPPPASVFAPAPPSVGPFNVYYGWYNVAIALAAITLAVGSTSYSFGLYIKPAAAELGLSRATTNLGLVLFHVGSALFSPLLGIMYDRLPIKTMVRVCAVLFLLGMTGVCFSTSPLLIGLFIVGPLAVGTAGSSSLFGVVLVSRWFTHRRSRAILIVTLGTSLGGMLIYPLMAFLMDKLGWRLSLVVTGGLVSGIIIMMSFLINPEPDPITVEQLAKGMPPKEPSLSARAILLMRDFWLIAVPVNLLLAVDGTMLVTFTPYMLDRGMSLAMTASVMSALTASAICGKLAIAWIVDRTDLRIWLMATAVCVIILCGILLTQPSYTGILLVSLLTGVAIGGTYPLGAALLAQRFGAASVGTAIGLQSPLLAISTTATLYFAGAVHDHTASYSFAYVVFGFICFLAMCLFLLIRRR